MTIRAFIIEDNATLCENLVATLHDLAHVEAVGTAETEQAATAWLRTHEAQWNLAIVDIFIRHGNGLNVLAACRQRLPGQKVVVLSNHATQEVRRCCAQLGADAVFDKSTEIDALVDYCNAERARMAQAAD